MLTGLSLGKTPETRSIELGRFMTERPACAQKQKYAKRGWFNNLHVHNVHCHTSQSLWHQQRDSHNWATPSCLTAPQLYWVLLAIYFDSLVIGWNLLGRFGSDARVVWNVSLEILRDVRYSYPHFTTSWKHVPPITRGEILPWLQRERDITVQKCIWNSAENFTLTRFNCTDVFS